MGVEDHNLSGEVPILPTDEGIVEVPSSMGGAFNMDIIEILTEKEAREREAAKQAKLDRAAQKKMKRKQGLGKPEGEASNVDEINPALETNDAIAYKSGSGGNGGPPGEVW